MTRRCRPAARSGSPTPTTSARDPKRLLYIDDGEHTLGGIAGEAVHETTDEDPRRVELVADAVSAYLLDVFGLSTGEWEKIAVGAAEGGYSVESK
ncbi:hypothetical protein MTX80_10960 [Gordonia amicalis]|nr:hypothetical protein [Gordonia amicalis]UOG23650.1 hypothetical protein MTX80_10960 [Gordonia amicalis]